MQCGRRSKGLRLSLRENSYCCWGTWETWAPVLGVGRAEAMRERGSVTTGRENAEGLVTALHVGDDWKARTEDAIFRLWFKNLPWIGTRWGEAGQGGGSGVVDGREILGSAGSGSLRTFRWGCAVVNRAESGPVKRNENTVSHSA